VEIGDNQFISLDLTRNAPDVHYEADPESYYTLIMYDISAPYPEDAHNSPFLHYLVNNIPGNQVEKGHQEIAYLAPNPPRDSDIHTYVVEIYKQEGRNRPTTRRQRNNFQLYDYTNQNRLTPVYSFNFVTGYEFPSVPVSTSMRQPRREKVVEQEPRSNISSRSAVPQRSNISSRSAVSRSAAPRRNIAALSVTSKRNIPVQRGLPEDKEKFCRCVLDVAKKEPQECLLEEKWYQNVNGKKCYNPAPVCAKSTGTSSRDCYAKSEAFDPQTMDDNELRAFANLIGIESHPNYNRNNLMIKIDENLEHQHSGKLPSDDNNSLSFLTKAELVAILRQKGLPVSGNKDVLIERLKNAD
jgi:hypothetical protein